MILFKSGKYRTKKQKLRDEIELLKCENENLRLEIAEFKRDFRNENNKCHICVNGALCRATDWKAPCKPEWRGIQENVDSIPNEELKDVQQDD